MNPNLDKLPPELREEAKKVLTESDRDLLHKCCFTQQEHDDNLDLFRQMTEAQFKDGHEGDMFPQFMYVNVDFKAERSVGLATLAVPFNTLEEKKKAMMGLGVQAMEQDEAVPMFMAIASCAWRVQQEPGVEMPNDLKDHPNRQTCILIQSGYCHPGANDGIDHTFMTTMIPTEERDGKVFITGPAETPQLAQEPRMLRWFIEGTMMATFAKMQKKAQAGLKAKSGYAVGDRMFALRNADQSGVNLFGYGVYDGDLPCPHLGGRPNPRITLDNGAVVWGCQCWWGPEAKFATEYAGAKVNIVPVPV